MTGVSAEQSPWSSRTPAQGVEDRNCQLPNVEATRLSFPERTQSSATVPFHHHHHHHHHHPVVPMASDAAVVLSPSSLTRSASAPPDYVPPLTTSRQLRTVHHGEFPVPPEVLETRRREKECSACCLKCIIVLTTLRWLFVSTSLLGAACVIVGIVFGVMSALDKNTYFALAFTFIGLGIVLVIVVGIGWRCAPAGHEPCHVLCHLRQRSSSSDGSYGQYESSTIRGAPRLMHRSRNQWFGGFLYPEFHYGTPPPSYTASMQQYRNQIARHQQPDGDSSVIGTSIISLDNFSTLPSSPPPTYRSGTVGRNRPSLSSIVNLTGNPDGQSPSPPPPPPPPPYTSDSRASSVNGLDVTNVLESGTCDVVPVLPSRDSIVEGPQTVSESRDQAPNSVDASSGAGINEDQPEAGQPSESSLPVANATVSSVHCMIQHYENLGHFRRTPAELGTAERHRDDTGTFHHNSPSSGVECNANSTANNMLPVKQVSNSRLRNDQPQPPLGFAKNAGNCDSPPITVTRHRSSAISSNTVCQSGEASEATPIQFIQHSRNKLKTTVQTYRSPTEHYKDFNRSQSLEDHDIGESGI